MYIKEDLMCVSVLSIVVNVFACIWNFYKVLLGHMTILGTDFTIK